VHVPRQGQGPGQKVHGQEVVGHGQLVEQEQEKGKRAGADADARKGNGAGEEEEARDWLLDPVSLLPPPSV
jgi:hypothetical protein